VVLSFVKVLSRLVSNLPKTKVHHIVYVYIVNVITKSS